MKTKFEEKKRRVVEVSIVTHPIQQRLNDLLFVLEHCTSEWGLAAVVECVRVGAMLEEESDEGKVAMIRSKHDLLESISGDDDGTEHGSDEHQSRGGRGKVLEASSGRGLRM